MESVGDAGERSDLGVGGFDESLVEIMFEVGVDGVAVFGDLLGEMGEGGEL